MVMDWKPGRLFTLATATLADNSLLGVRLTTFLVASVVGTTLILLFFFIVPPACQCDAELNEIEASNSELKLLLLSDEPEFSLA